MLTKILLTLSIVASFPLAAIAHPEQLDLPLQESNDRESSILIVSQSHPKDAEAYNERGNTYYDLQQYDKALADYSKAIEIDPYFAKAYYNRGIIYDDLQQYDKALAD